MSAIRIVAAALVWFAGCQLSLADTVRVRLAYVPVIGAAPAFVMTGAGWAKEAGLDIVPIRFESGPPAINALASGTIDAMVIGVAPVAVARAKGLDVRIVAAASNGGSALVGIPRLTEAFTAAGGDVRKAFALFHERNGRPVGLGTLPPGAVPTVALNHWLFKLNAVDRADVRIAQMGIDAVQQAILSGGIDAGTELEPVLTITLARDPRYTRIVTVDQMFSGIPGVVLAVSGAFAKAHPDAVDELVRSSIRATDFIRENPDQAAQYVQPVFGGGLVDAPTLTRALTSDAVSFVTDPQSITAATERLLAYQVELGDFEKAPPTDGLFDFAPYGRVVTK